MNTTRWIAGAIGVAGLTTVSILAARRIRRRLEQIGPVTATVTVNRTPRATYELMRDFARWPEFMTYVSKVEEDGPRSAWTAVIPMIGEVRWAVRLVEDRPGELIQWEALEDRDTTIRTTGRISFTPTPGDDSSTEVRVEMKLGVFGRPPSRALARIIAAPSVKGDLRRLKQVLETGEVLRSDASAHIEPHAAQPAPDAMPAPDFFIPHVKNVSKEAKAS